MNIFRFIIEEGSIELLNPSTPCKKLGEETKTPVHPDACLQTHNTQKTATRPTNYLRKWHSCLWWDLRERKMKWGIEIRTLVIIRPIIGRKCDFKLTTDTIHRENMKVPGSIRKVRKSAESRRGSRCCLLATLSHLRRRHHLDEL